MITVSFFPVLESWLAALTSSFDSANIDSELKLFAGVGVVVRAAIRLSVLEVRVSKRGS